MFRKMNKGPRTAMLATAAALTLSFAGWGQETPAAGRVSLKFAPRAETFLSYLFQTQVNVEGKDFLGKDIRVEVQSDGGAEFLVMASQPGTVRTAVTIPGISLHASMPDSSLSGTIRTRPSSALEVVFNSAGKVNSITNTEALEQDFQSNISFTQMLSDYFPVLPLQLVAPGATWKDSRRIRLPYQGVEVVVNLDTEYRLDDVMPSPDGPKAFISTSYAATVYGERPLSDGVGVFEGSGSGSGFLHFLVDKGLFSTYQFAFKVEAAFSVKRQSQVLMRWPFSFFASSLINLGQARFAP